MSAVSEMKGSMRRRARERRQDGRAGWSRETVDADADLHRATGQLNRLHRVVDWAANWYEERIEGPDGTVIREVSEPLDQHRDRGAAKRGTKGEV
jgi:hypothetical protein